MAAISERFDNLGANGQPCRLGIMGGTFDPVHIGHLALAECARVQCALDAVLFIPTGNPVFKKDIQVTPANVRFDMVRAAVAGNLRFDVSPIEVLREGDTYTVDTLRALRAHYPQNVELCFITGSDAAADIDKWKDAAEIARLATIIVAERPGSPLSKQDKQRILTAAPFKLEFIQVPALEIASHDIRSKVAAGAPFRYYVPPEAYEIICTQGLYGMRPAGAVCVGEGAPEDTGAQGTNGVGGGNAPVNPWLENGEAGLAAATADALSGAFIDARKAQLRLRVKPKRFTHIMGVADMAKTIAAAYGVNQDQAYLAGLLHDWDKGFNAEEIRKRAQELGVPCAPGVYEQMPQLLHGPCAARALKLAYPQIPAAVLQAIARHTTGEFDMSDLDMVVYVADAIEPNRDYPGVKKLRKLIGAVPLAQLYQQTFAHTLRNLLERGFSVHPSTIAIWNRFAMRYSFSQEATEGKKK